MDLFRHFGVIAAAGDRHLAEFCPPAWYLKDPETVRLWCFGLTPVSWRIDSREKLKKKSAEYRNGTEELVPERSDEEGLRQMRALLGLGNLTTNVNLPNRGQMPGFPEGAVVETNAVFSRDSVRPVIAGRLPYPLEPLVLQHAKNQEGIVRAAIERDLDKAFMVFLNDPAVCGLNREDARALFGEMTAATLPPDYADSLSLTLRSEFIRLGERPRETGLSSRHEILLNEIMELIHKKYTDPMLSVVYIADQFHLSESYFSHLFKGLSGESFSVYLEKMRLAKARELLRDTYHDIEEISRRVGYFNSTSFRRAFKRMYGISPSAFRSAPANVKDSSDYP
jgi:AraC-like DNA-binding protein